MVDTLRISWEGADGSSWDLLDPLSPVFAVSIKGLGMPGFLNQWTVSGARDGQRYEGTQWNANTITMIVQVGDTYTQPGFTRRRTGDEWRKLDRDWNRSLSAEKEGRLVVETNLSGRRYLSLRLDAPPDEPGERNPAILGQATYVYVLTAGERPWWEGDPIEAEFPWSVDNKAFFSEDGEPNEVGLYVAEDAALDAAQLYNPGDREAYPKWWAQGPFGEVHIGVGNAFAQLPFSLSSEQRVYVDSYDQTITDQNGTNLWPLMGHSDPLFPPIPAGAETPLYTLLEDAGSGAAIGVTIVPRYARPW